MASGKRAFVGSLVASGLIASISMPLAAAEDFDKTVRSIVGVRFEHAENDVSEGMGVHVGNGRVYTAAHVLGSAKAQAPVTIPRGIVRSANPALEAISGYRP